MTDTPPERYVRMTHTCAICERPIPDTALVCTVCTNGAIGRLAEIVRLHPYALEVARGIVRHGTGGGGGKPASRPPVNVEATDALAAIGNALTTIAREIADVRGVGDPAGWHLPPAESHAALGPEEPSMTDPIITAARFINDQMRWLRGAIDEQGQPYAPHVFAEIDHCARRIRSLVDGPGAKKYLGPCGAPTLVEVIPEDVVLGIGAEYETRLCEGDVYGRPGGDTGTCRTCGARVDQAERRAWLDDEVRSRAFRASEIEDAYGVKANLIRQWATPARDLVQVHGHDREGRALYLLSQVLDVARDMAARRAERQAEKARRAAARAAESESVA